jgi:hypothetical protein
MREDAPYTLHRTAPSRWAIHGPQGTAYMTADGIEAARVCDELNAAFEAGRRHERATATRGAG